MTIRPGEPWERPSTSIEAAAVARRDRDVVTLAGWASPGTRPAGPVRLRGGDLHRMLGSPSLRPDPVAAEIDLLEVTDPGTGEVLGRAAAHVVVGGLDAMWRGRVVVACNAGQVGPFELAPRAHPGDGLVDVVTIAGRMPLRQRIAALRRARSGSHLPHPDIGIERLTAVEITLDRPALVRIDGVRSGRVRAVRIGVVADAVTIVF
ncbi:MAG: hypothetical protein ACO35E_01500 [Ilumatobacteraceae bacterium]